MTAEECVCLQPQVPAGLWELRALGIDATNGRFGEVSLAICKRCGRQWLHYLVEYEAFSSSGRWYRGLLTPSQAAQVTPEGAVTMLEGLDWYIYGGSYFNSRGRRGSGPLAVGL